MPTSPISNFSCQCSFHFPTRSQTPPGNPLVRATPSPAFPAPSPSFPDSVWERTCPRDSVAHLFPSFPDSVWERTCPRDSIARLSPSFPDSVWERPCPRDSIARLSGPVPLVPRLRLGTHLSARLRRPPFQPRKRPATYRRVSIMKTEHRPVGTVDCYLSKHSSSVPMNTSSRIVLGVRGRKPKACQSISRWLSPQGDTTGKPSKRSPTLKGSQRPLPPHAVFHQRQSGL